MKNKPNMFFYDLDIMLDQENTVLNNYHVKLASDILRNKISIIRPSTDLDVLVGIAEKVVEEALQKGCQYIACTGQSAFITILTLCAYKQGLYPMEELKVMVTKTTEMLHGGFTTTQSWEHHSWRMMMDSDIALKLGLDVLVMNAETASLKSKC